MRSLNELLQTTQGRQHLRNSNIFTSLDEFIDHLSPPRSSALGAYLQQERKPLVWAGQQVYTDCTSSMISRMKTLLNLQSGGAIFPFFLWVDTDRAGSDKLTMRFFWPQEDGMLSIRICPVRLRNRETRFIQLERNFLQRAYSKLGNALSQSIIRGEAKQAAQERLRRLEPLFSQDPPPTLALYNRQLCEFLLEEKKNRSPNCSAFLHPGSENIGTRYRQMINRLEAIIPAFNERINELNALQIHSPLHRLPVDYLPVNYACPHDGRRLKLRHKREGSHHYAAAGCDCGRNYRFYLGDEHLSIEALEESGRWSPDVFMTLFFHDLVSGYVAGQSSAIYFGLIMNEVWHRLFATPRLPIFIPPDLLQENNFSLLHAYLVGLRI